MKNVYTYDNLKRKAIETRGDLFEKDIFCRAGRRVRRKPRPHKDLDILLKRAMERANQYIPYYDKDGKLILPYFSKE